MSDASGSGHVGASGFSGSSPGCARLGGIERSRSRLLSFKLAFLPPRLLCQPGFIRHAVAPAPARACPAPLCVGFRTPLFPCLRVKTSGPAPPGRRADHGGEVPAGADGGEGLFGPVLYPRAAAGQPRWGTRARGRGSAATCTVGRGGARAGWGDPLQGMGGRATVVPWHLRLDCCGTRVVGCDSRRKWPRPRGGGASTRVRMHARRLSTGGPRCSPALASSLGRHLPA